MRHLVIVSAAGSAAALLLTAPGPRSALRSLTVAGPPADPTAQLVAAITLLAWALAGWLVLTVVLTSGAELGGRTGTACTALLRRTAPAMLRRAVALALGVGVVLGGAGTASAAGPESPAPSSAAASAALDWPGASTSAPGRAVVPEPGLDWPSSHARPGEVVVAQGDTLWGLAAARLPGGATDAKVAEAWPTWWAANRAVIGEDPNLLLPGQHLLPPAQPQAGR